MLKASAEEARQVDSSLRLLLTDKLLLQRHLKNSVPRPLFTEFPGLSEKSDDVHIFGRLIDYLPEGLR